MAKFLSHNQVKNLIKTIGHKRTVLVEGPAGSSKTSIAYALAAEEPFKSKYYTPKPIDCTQLSDGSVWMPDIDRARGVSRELPNERFGVSDENHKGVDNAKPAVICLDEIAKTRQFIKDVLAPIVYERRVGNYEFPEGSIVFGCTNLSEEGLGDMLQAHLRNRLTIVKMRPPTADEWLNDYAIPHGVNEIVAACAKQHPEVFECFMDYRTGGSKDGKKQAAENPYIFNPSNAAQTQFVTPRSLVAAADIVDTRHSMDMDTLECALAGTVGEAFAARITTMIQFGEQLPDFTLVMADPANAPLPSKPMACLIQVMQFLNRVKSREHAEAAAIYVGRMREEFKSMFVASVCNNNQALFNFGMSAKFAAMLAAHQKFVG